MSEHEMIALDDYNHHEEEAAYFFCLSDFESFVEEFGAAKLLEDMAPNVVEKLREVLAKD